ncbi:hypothetical protein LTR78_003209 [Recurvomyces mirabilis]|uniref:Uncharacterized protein n=1 Tax=Recurvomyces mirabilis TaxID=574656 RepID=A0AAE0WS45_9PEZI|nr:hypothetical protein LTR78_003209 [Recurvomyces mirabilis]KAK5156971.1 hypothetical protein LTS14_004488 [Recurvomyces mirabilis]
MLSHANSSPGERVRRAKSTSSQNTTSSGHQRASTSIDPLVAKQQAETAAVEAFHRAGTQADNAAAARPQAHRRRNQRTEGSHFEDARLGRRRSGSKRRDSMVVPPVNAVARPTKIERAVDGSGEERIVTRKRCIIPPASPTTSRSVNQQYLNVPSSEHIRQAQSVDASGSPAPRYRGSTTDHSQGAQTSSQTLHQRTDEYARQMANLSDFDEPTTRTTVSFTQSTREMQTDDQIMAYARDRCLQDFQQQKIRERKSFILAPFQKRRGVTVGRSATGGYDTMLPPFNQADNVDMQAFQTYAEPVQTSLNPAPKAPTRSRYLHETIKNRVKSAFRKVSKAPTALPAQHFEATQLHYIHGPLVTPTERPVDPFESFGQAPSDNAGELRTASAHSHGTAGQESEARSRITSWTNSTVAGTLKSTATAGRGTDVGEYGGRLGTKRSSATLRKATSFFGRPVQNKLRRSSKAELNTSEESQGLYSALQTRFRSSNRTSTPELIVTGVGNDLSRGPLALSNEALPQPTSRYSTPTIRSVTPDPLAFKHGICSPVPEALSPEARTGDVHDPYDLPAPPSSLTRRHATRAPWPSQEQLQKRAEQSKNRWQSPLDELSPRPSKADMQENPYELQILNAAWSQPVARNDLPHSSKVGVSTQQHVRPDVLSPSVYSQASNCASPRPLTPPVDRSGMIVTITGHEVRSYSISPPKQEQPVKSHSIRQTSGQWRRWLSDEMHSFRDAVKEDLPLAQAFLDGHTGHDRSISEQSNQQSGNVRPSSLSPVLGARPDSVAMSNGAAASNIAGRPRLRSRGSSFMNERFPMLDTGRNSSDQSIRSRRFSSGAGSSSERDGTARLSLNGRTSGLSAKQRVITGRASIAQMQPAVPDTGIAATRNLPAKVMMSGALIEDEKAIDHADNDTTTSIIVPPRSRNRHKSAFELRANYKRNITTHHDSFPIENNKHLSASENKNTISILEDNTIRNISAGPYAAQQAIAACSRSKNRKENTPPPMEMSNLPALSSSEWLAAGPNKSKRPETIHPALRQRRSVSRYSPPNQDGKGSPAQRMASEWLEKRSRESTSAFV